MAEPDDAPVGVFVSGSAGLRRAARFDTERHRYEQSEAKAARVQVPRRVGRLIWKLHKNGDANAVRAQVPRRVRGDSTGNFMSEVTQKPLEFKFHGV